MEVDEEAINMPQLIGLPHEILHNVLKWVDPEDLAALSASCQALHRFVTDNKALFKDIYLQRLDDPFIRQDAIEPDWGAQLKSLVRLQKLVASDSAEYKRSHLQFVTDTVTSLLRASAPHKRPSQNVTLLSHLFASTKTQDTFFCNSSLFERAKAHTHNFTPCSFQDRQLSAKLHCLFGVPIGATGRTRASRTYPYACSKVYDLRNYTDNTMWGPFREDGSQFVDWERVEAIMVLLGHNLRILSEHTNNEFCKSIWSRPFVDAVPDSQIPRSPPTPSEDLALTEQQQLDALDPYNISGTYLRVVCFLDYNELFLYNFVSEQPPHGHPRPPLDTSEAIRIIAMEVTVTKIEPPGPEDGQGLPVVHFKGTSRSMHEQWDPNANANLRGWVRLTKEGEVRWTSFSIYHGEERWRSEGIQVGGLRSARGVIGNWFDKDYDIHGPAGPTAFWKVSNSIDITRTREENDVEELDHHVVGGGQDDDEDEEDDEDYEPGNENAEENEEEELPHHLHVHFHHHHHHHGNREEDEDDDEDRNGGGGGGDLDFAQGLIDIITVVQGGH